MGVVLHRLDKQRQSRELADMLRSDQRPKKSELSGWQLSMRKNFPDEVRESFSRQIKCVNCFRDKKKCVNHFQNKKSV